MKTKQRHKKNLARRRKVGKKVSNSVKQRKLAHMEELAPFLSIIEEEYKPINISLYRWMHVPQNQDDYRPQIFQESNPMCPEQLGVPPVDAPRGVILDYVSWFSLSNFVSVESATEEWRRILSKRISNVSEKKILAEIKKWISKKGQYIIKVDYTPETAIVGPQDDGTHKQALLYSDVDVETLIDKTFEPIKIDLS